MRVATNQFYQTSISNILQNQSDVNDTQSHMASGYAVESAGDDSVAANSIYNFEQELRVIEQYKSNVTYANARLKAEESTMYSLEDILNRIKELTLSANNGAMGADEREAVAQELEEKLEEMMSLANTKDEAGNYIFGGYKTEDMPFTIQNDGTVSYWGDEGERELTLGAGVIIKTNDSGSDVFMQIQNSVGGYRPSYEGTNTAGNPVTNTGTAYVETAKIIDPANYDSIGVPQPYKVEFVDLDGDSVMEYQVFDANGNQQMPATAGTSAVYEPNEPIIFNGVEIQISGKPAVGDVITLEEQETQSVFVAVKNAIDWMRQDRTTDEQKNLLSVEMGHIISDLDESIKHVSAVHANVGSRLQIAQSQSSINTEYKLTIDTALVNLRDLDYAKASIDLSQQMVALEASQQAFVKVQSLTLFNLI